ARGVPGAKGGGGGREGREGKAATGNIGKRVATEEHQIGVALVDPERDLCSVLRVPKFDASKAVRAPLQVGERVVERCRADAPRYPEIILSVLHGFRARRQAAFVRPQHGTRWDAQDQPIDGRGAEGQVRMSAASVGTSFRADVRGRGPHVEATARQQAFNSKPEPSR